MKQRYKVLLQTEAEIDEGTATQTKVEINLDELKEKNSDMTDREIITEVLHEQFQRVIDHSLFSDADGEQGNNEQNKNEED